jgi:DNA-binding response OmpR family regulator
VTRVLLIDDDAEQAAPVAERLQSLGYDVETTAAVRAGLTLLSVDRCDVIILDVGGTGCGVEAVSRLRRLHPRTDVIVWSGWEWTALAECLDLGASQVLLKPCSVGQIVLAIEATQRAWTKHAVDDTFLRLKERRSEELAAVPA